MYTLVNVNYIPLTGSRTHTCRIVSKIHDISIEYNGIKTQWWTPFRVVLYNFRNLIAICNMFYIYVCISNTSFKINSKLCYTPCIMSIRLSTSSKFGFALLDGLFELRILPSDLPTSQCHQICCYKRIFIVLFQKQ